MRKIIVYAITTVLIIVLLLSGVMTIASYSRVQIEDDIDLVWQEEPKYRMMVIVDGSDASYVSAIKEGLNQSAIEHQVAYEFWEFSGDDKDEQIIRQLDIALRSNVNGVIVEAVNDSLFDSLIEKADDFELAVVTLEKSLPESERLSFITLNQYEIGNMIGLRLKNELNSRGSVVIFNDSEDSINDQAAAINGHLKNYYDVRVETSGYDSEIILDAEDTTQQLLLKHSDIVSVICNGSEESIGVIQALKDANKLDEIKVVAFGDDETILDYVRRDIITGTIVPDIEKMGYMALKNLYDFNEGNLVPSYQNIPVELITHDNIEQVLDENKNN